MKRARSRTRWRSAGKSSRRALPCRAERLARSPSRSPHNMGIAKLGHVGIHCNDLEATEAFYRDVVGLTVTDEDLQAGMVFLSAQPDQEHHELVLLRGRDVPFGAM